MSESLENFFAKNTAAPTAWSCSKGSFVGFCISKDLMKEKEDEKLVKSLASKYGLKITYFGSIVSFDKL